MAVRFVSVKSASKILLIKWQKRSYGKDGDIKQVLITYGFFTPNSR